MSAWRGNVHFLQRSYIGYNKRTPGAGAILRKDWPRQTGHFGFLLFLLIICSFKWGGENERERERNEIGQENGVSEIWKLLGKKMNMVKIYNMKFGKNK